MILLINERRISLDGAHRFFFTALLHHERSSRDAMRELDTPAWIEFQSWVDNNPAEVQGVENLLNFHAAVDVAWRTRDNWITALEHAGHPTITIP